MISAEAAPAATTNTSDSPELEALFDSIAAAQYIPTASRPAQSPHALAEGDLVSRVGHLTRKLHDTLRELGADRALEKASSAIPDACERLSYVATMTETAAHRALNAIDAAKPLQDSLEQGAEGLSADWERFYRQELNIEQFKHLVEHTRAFLSNVPKQTCATNQQLNEIMMAQDFQDLTGQVVKRVTAMVKEMESSLLQLLIDNVPAAKREAMHSSGLLNGPVINGEGHSDVVTSQQQVDDLLQSLGF